MTIFGKRLLFTIMTGAMILSTNGCAITGVQRFFSGDSSATPAAESRANLPGTVASTKPASKLTIISSNTLHSEKLVHSSGDSAGNPRPNYSIRVPILMYHDITYLKGNSLGMSPASFSAQMKYLYDNGFHTISFDQLYAAFYEGAALPSKPILLTFDDGYESVYKSAYPVMKQYGQIGTVFMITGVVGKRTGYPELTWNELTEMEASGVMDIESHTVHHVDLGVVPNTTGQFELQQSARTLSRHLGHPIRYFCYPSSRYTPATIADLKRDGYLLAVTEHPGVASLANGPYELKRLRVSEGISLQGFSLLVHQDK